MKFSFIVNRIFKFCLGYELISTATRTSPNVNRIFFLGPNKSEIYVNKACQFVCMYVCLQA